MHQTLAGFIDIPLHMTGQTGAIIEHRQSQGLDPRAGAREHLARAVVIVKMPKCSHVIDLVATHFARLTVAFGGTNVATLTGASLGKVDSVTAPGSFLVNGTNLGMGLRVT